MAPKERRCVTPEKLKTANIPEKNKPAPAAASSDKKDSQPKRRTSSASSTPETVEKDVERTTGHQTPPKEKSPVKENSPAEEKSPVKAKCPVKDKSPVKEKSSVKENSPAKEKSVEKKKGKKSSKKKQAETEVSILFGELNHSNHRVPFLCKGLQVTNFFSQKSVDVPPKEEEKKTVEPKVGPAVGAAAPSKDMQGAERAIDLEERAIDVKPSEAATPKNVCIAAFRFTHIFLRRKKLSLSSFWHCIGPSEIADVLRTDVICN